MNRKQRRKSVAVDTTELEKAIDRAEKGKIKVENATFQSFLSDIENQGATRKPQGTVQDVMDRAERDGTVARVRSGLPRRGA